MELPIIPWPEFLAALNEQESSAIEIWLRGWLFMNEGVILADARICDYQLTRA
jgi:hypothetical protein